MNKKKILLLFLLLWACTAVFSIPKPKEGKGSILGIFNVQMNDTFGDVKKGIYTNSVQLIIYNKKTGKRYNAYTKPGGYLYFLNLPPGIYKIAYWKIHLSEGNSQTDLSCTIDDRVMEFSVKPGVVSIFGVVKSEVSFLKKDQKRNQDINGYDEWSGKIERIQKSIVQKSENQINKLIGYFKKLDRRKKWENVTFE